MVSVSDVRAEDVMTTSFKTISHNETLNRALAVIRRADIHNIVVLKDGKYDGFFGYKQLIKLHETQPELTKVTPYVFRPPAVARDTSLVDIAAAMYKTNYKILPVMEKGRLVGLVSERDVLDVLVNIGELKGRKAEEFMTPNPLTLTEKDVLGRAVQIMREQNISRIPVTKEGRLSGVLESVDVIQELTASIDFATAQDKADGSMASPSYMPDPVPSRRVAVSSLMKTRLVTAGPEEPLADKFREMKKLGMSTVMVVDDGKVIGIITPKDIIEHVAKLAPRTGIVVALSGLEDEASIDEFQAGQIHRMVGETVQKLASLRPVQDFSMHFKAYRKQGPAVKYSLRCKALVGGTLYTVRDFGWDLIAVTNDILEKLERLVISDVRKKKDASLDRKRTAKFRMR